MVIRGIWEREWDYLIILDACRYDYFKRLNWIGGELFMMETPGADTKSFIEATFKVQRPFLGIIAGNPYFERRSGLFGFMYSGWKDIPEGCWDIEVSAVRAECMTNTAIKYTRMYPKMKFIIWYVQPHYPFLGNPPHHERNNKRSGVEYGLWVEKHNKFDEVKLGYEGNLIYVLKEVERLLPNLSKKVVITSDHGELIGEYNRFGHTRFERYPETVNVPWLEVTPMN